MRTWTYDLCGELKAAPRSDHEPDAILARAIIHCFVLRMKSWDQRVFANVDDCRPLESYFGPVLDIIAESGIDLDSLKLWERSRWDARANWRTMLENYLASSATPWACSRSPQSGHQRAGTDPVALRHVSDHAADDGRIRRAKRSGADRPALSAADRAKEPLRAFLVKHSDPGEQAFSSEPRRGSPSRSRNRGGRGDQISWSSFPPSWSTELTTAFQIRVPDLPALPGDRPRHLQHPARARHDDAVAGHHIASVRSSCCSCWWMAG